MYLLTWKLSLNAYVPNMLYIYLLFFLNIVTEL
jgi:hypothetical protein